MLAYPNIDPVFIHLGPVAIRWYGLAYIAGIVGGMRLAYPHLKRLGLSVDSIWDLPTYLIAGILLGGRLGYVLVYDFAFYSGHPFHVFSVWEGGMSYHGAAIGAVLGIWVYSIKKKVSLWTLLDLLGWASTLGIGLGRVANFINGELYGRVTALPWGMVFPNAGVLPRHPSQLYEALGEGLLLWGILTLAHRYLKLRDGQLFGLYMMGYGAIRFGIEFAREPDVQVGYLFGAITAGQALCLLMVILGSWVYRKRG